MSSYRCVFLMGVEQALEYRVSFFLSMLSAAFPIIIQTAMWNYLYRHIWIPAGGNTAVYPPGNARVPAGEYRV